MACSLGGVAGEVDAELEFDDAAGCDGGDVADQWWGVGSVGRAGGCGELGGVVCVVAGGGAALPAGCFLGVVARFAEAQAVVRGGGSAVGVGGGVVVVA